MRRHAFPTNAGPVRTAVVRAKWLRLAAAAIVAGAGMHAADGSADQLYLRAGMGLDRPAETAFTDLDCSSASPAALYGCGRGGGGAPYRSVGDFGTAPVLELGLGYAAAPAVRLEVLAEYRPHLAFDGRANFLATARRQSVVAKLSSLSAILAAYVDLPGLGLPRLGPLAPFVGAGVGAAPHLDRRNPHDLSGDDDHRAGREPHRFRLDADGRGRGDSGRAHDARSRLALQRPRRGPYRFAFSRLCNSTRFASSSCP